MNAGRSARSAGECPPARLEWGAAGQLMLYGALDFASVGCLARDGGERFATHRRDAAAGSVASASLTIDLSGVESANSAGLALLLEWLEQAERHGVRLRYRALPDSLRRIAAFSNLAELLPVDP